MPLTGQAKTDYQSRYMTKYMQDYRAGIRRRKVVKTQPIPDKSVKTQTESVKTHVIPVTITPESVEPVSQQPVSLSDLRAKAQAIIDRPVEEVVEIPVYNRNIHKPGDTVLLQGKVVIGEETDDLGEIIRQY